MNKKKILVVAMSLAMVAILAIGSTIAYFTDTDSATNTMTLGNVSIVQNEKDADDNDFLQNQKMMPGVYTEPIDGTNILGEDGLFNKAISNVIDKFVTVTNKGSEAAYIRTILAFETQRHYKEGSSTEYTDLHDLYFLVNADNVDYTTEYITVDGVEYVLAVCVYENPVAAGATTDPSLKQIILTPDANNETTTWFGNEYTILALSQAVQSEGFTAGAEDALNTAFGEVNAANAQAWFDAI